MHDLALIDQSFAFRVSATLVHFLWQGGVIALLVLAVGTLMRHTAAKRLYLLHLFALLAMAVCLPVTFLCIQPPALAPRDAAPSVAEMDNQDDSPAEHDARLPPETVNAGTAGPVVGELRKVVPVSDSFPADPVVPVSAMSELSVPPSEDLKVGGLVQRWARYITTLYLVGVALLLMRLIHGAVGGVWLRRKSTAIADESIFQAIQRQADRFGLRVAPAIAWCAEVSAPVVVGVVKPIILLPVAVATGLTSGQLESLVMHELAHIRRYDLLVNVFQRLIQTVLFFHPAVWLISRRVDREREQACDELVLAMGCEPAVYADSLVRTAELSFALRGRRWPVQVTSLSVAGAGPSELKRRVLKILGVAERPRMCSGEIALLVITMSTAVALPVTLAQMPVASAAQANEPLSDSTFVGNAGNENGNQGRTLKDADRARKTDRPESPKRVGVVGSWNEGLTANSPVEPGGDVEPAPEDETPVPAAVPDPKLAGLPLIQQVSPASPPAWATSTRETSYFGNWIKGPLFLDGDRILWGSSIIKASTGKLLGKFPFGEDADLITGARLSRNRKYLLVQGTTKTEPNSFTLPSAWLQVWDVAKQTPFGHRFTRRPRWQGVIADVTSDGKTIAIAEASKVTLWNISTGEQAKTLPIDLAEFKKGYQGRPAHFNPEVLKFGSSCSSARFGMSRHPTSACLVLCKA